MTTGITTLTPGQAAYNQALNEYLDRPSESTLNNLKVVAHESGIKDAALIKDIAQRHFAETKFQSMAPIQKDRALSKTSSVNDSASTPFRVQEFTVQRLMKSSKPVDIAPKGKQIGLPNPTNTSCFGNATLQAFFLSSPQAEALLTTPLTKRVDHRGKVESSSDFQKRVDLQTNLRELKAEYERKPAPRESELTKILTKLWSSEVVKDAHLNPLRAQEDPHELLVHLFDSLDASKHPEFSYVEYSAIHSKKDGTTNHKRDGASTIININGLDANSPTLQKTLNRMFEVEKIEGGEKRIYFRSADPTGMSPRNLAVRLPSVAHDGRKEQKVHTPIQGFNERVKLPISDENGEVWKHAEYQVSSVVCHFGKTAQSGHYITIVRTEDGWKECNDRFVRPISEKEALSTIEEYGYLVRMSWVKDIDAE